MKVKATILDTVTGRITADVHEWPASTEEGTVVFEWRDNNWSCDCNRARVHGIDDHPCGESRFILTALEIDGKPVAKEEFAA